jgi:Immunoglobulin domain/Immunoglobulin I-set domain
MHAGRASGRGLLSRYKAALCSIVEVWATANVMARPIPLLGASRTVTPRQRSHGLRLLGIFLGTAIISLTSGCAGGWQGSTSANAGQTSITQPQSQTVNVGQAATFSVTATGTGPFTYQWFQNGQPISGANSGTYTISAPSMTDNGAVFTVVVTGPNGSMTSIGATLTVKPIAPTITTQPASQTVQAGDSGTFTVAATGTGPLSYQWYLNGVAIIGATGTTYTTPATSTGNTGGVYTVTVTNAAGLATSVAATLTVTSSTPIAASLVPSSATPPYKGTVQLVPTFSNGTAVIGSAGVGSSDITASAVSGGSYATPALTAGKTYTLTVTGPKGDVVSTTCIVAPTPVTITPVMPANQIFAPGPETFAATASGGVTNNLTWTASSGTFAGNVWTSPVLAGTYTITATSVDNPSVSVSTNVTIAAVAINTQPASQRVCNGGVLTLTVSASYATSYQWNLNGTAIPTATNSTYSVSAATSANSGNYTVTVTNGLGSLTSSVASVVVGSSITANPTNLSISATQTATFAVSAAGQNPFTYQWYQVPSGGSTGAAIAGATSSSYTTPAVDSTYNGAKYYATVTDSCAGAPLTSSAATLTVTVSNVPPTITTQPVGESVAVGGTTASFTVVASGTPALAYQWYRVPAGQVIGTRIVGATSATYNVPASATTTGNDQDAYYVIVSNAYGQAVSLKAPLAVGNGILLQITGQPADQYVNEGDPATFTVTATSNLPLTYQWYRADPGTSTFAAIPGATNPTYTLDPAALSDNGAVYHVVVSNGSTSPTTSNPAALFVGPLAGVDDLCSTTWSAQGTAVAQPSCAFQLTAATNNQRGAIVWPTLISTGDIHLSFTVAISNPSVLPADGFTVLLGDPSLGATPASVGQPGQGLAAQGIPGLVLAFDTYHNGSEPAVPYFAIGRGETAQWEKPWFVVNTSIPALASGGTTVTHIYTVSIAQGKVTVMLDGAQIFSGDLAVPPVAYLYVTASTGGSWEQTVISNVSATVSAPSQ